MRRFRVTYKEQAAADIESIRDYWDQFSNDDANAVVNKLTAAVRSLEFLPTRNRIVAIRKDHHRNVYAMFVLSYWVYYRIDERAGVVRVITLRHAARRQPKRFP